MKKIVFIALVCFSMHTIQPSNTTFDQKTLDKHVTTQNMLTILGTIKVFQSLYGAASEAITLNKLKSKGKTNEALACKERLKHHGKTTLKAAAVVAASRIFSNDEITKTIQCLSIYMLFNRLVD